MKKEFKTGLIVLIVLVCIVTGISVASICIPKNSDASNVGKGYISLLHLEGTIQNENESYNQEWILNNIEKFKKDKKNKGIALYINSPGGAVYQADQVYLALKDYQSSGKKLYVYFGPMAASGGYYIGCAGDKVWANRNTLTGSIGVIAGQSFDLTEFLEDLGIKSETIHAGKNKNMFNYNEAVTDEQREIMQSVADECYDQFCNIVASERNMKLEKVYELADGRIYTANQAYINGLIDNIGTLKNMINQLISEVDEGDLKVIEYKYEGKKNIYSYLIGKTNILNKQAISSAGIPQKIIEDINQKDLYPAYLYK